MGQPSENTLLEMLEVSDETEVVNTKSENAANESVNSENKSQIEVNGAIQGDFNKKSY